MKKPNDGGPAFPQPMTFNSHGQPATPSMYFPDVSGMTLRDWFAGMALQGWLASYDANSKHPSDADNAAYGLALQSYDMADAMLAARERKEGA